MADVEVLVEAKNTLGEGPMWNVRDQALYWTDAKGKPRIQRWDPKSGDINEWAMPDLIGSFVFREKGGLIAGLKSGFYELDLDKNSAELFHDPEPGKTDNRLNDGKCDRRGRYWCGSLDDTGEASAALYRVDPDLSVHKMDDGVKCSNGIAFSPDNKTMYFSDSRSQTCFQYDYDIETGAISNKRIWVDNRDKPARIDGATVDAEGYYWAAHIRHWAIAKYAPDGTVIETIELPVQHPTMCTFGGENLDTLYVTSGRVFLEDEELQEQPLAGALFAIHGTGATGLPETFFAG
ncbi:MAG TPA: calcium-binding protein [Rhodospirillaceae bacterium]|nr:calcium-binding protein [Rhodospirillaceae bacterium]HAA93420.1 calcium-binding protein [Rhodospirillaceae bacterium]HAT35518.1 calcium-binding protein [Rhodospirillaceae bacterium]